MDVRASGVEIDEDRDGAPARSVASLDGRTIRPDARTADAFEAMQRARAPPSRRLD
jgi:hypothetical protein